MAWQSIARLSTIVGIAFICSGCVSFPTTVYVPDPAPGKLIYEPCSLNRSVPVGLAVEVQGVHANVSLMRNGDAGFVEVRFDVPVGTTLVLEENVVMVGRRTGESVERARFPNINLTDRAIFSSYQPSPTLEDYTVPVGTPLVGGDTVINGRHWDKHFWIAARADIDANDVWVTLPPLTINGVPAGVPELHFHRRLILALAPLNC